MRKEIPATGVVTRRYRLTMDVAVQTEGLRKSFGSTKALDGLDLTVPEGTILGLLGPNGAGKTTAVRILTTLLIPDAGRAVVAGVDVLAQPTKARRLMGLTGQFAAVDDYLTGRENLIMFGRLYHLSRAEAKRRADELLERFDLMDAAGRLAKTYSGGMRRRLDLAASLVGNPQVVYLDEPTTGLDPRGRSDLWRVVRNLVGGGATVLLTTQYMEEADQLADDIVVIDRGKVAATGTPDQLKTKVGGQILVVSPVEEADLGTVAGVVAELSRQTPELSHGAVSLPVNDPALPPAILQRLTDAGVALSELSLRKPSLDEVFFTLTGHRTDEVEPGDDDDSDRSAA
jgi:oleandomycin transport system ATP-binding protein